MYMHVRLAIMDILYQHYEMQHDLQQNAHPENSDHTHFKCHSCDQQTFAYPWDLEILDMTTILLSLRVWTISVVYMYVYQLYTYMYNRTCLSNKGLEQI